MYLSQKLNVGMKLLRSLKYYIYIANFSAHSKQNQYTHTKRINKYITNNQSINMQHVAQFSNLCIGLFNHDL